ncbi:MAG: hypothetical protein JWO05_3066 [Gemmatimonadetes bacterium]|nr:hypothetical protein [Gemmatimonadota bacterium]
MSNDTKASGVKRRDFLKILGAGTAAVSAAACSEPTGKLIPYLVSPDQTVPGVSTYYASTCRECAAGCGIIVETRDGRAIKIEGNPEHPLSRGALCARGQSALQGLYNPDRFQGPMIKQAGEWKPITWDDALSIVGQKLGEVRAKGAAGAVFINQHESGSFPAFLDAWLGGFGMRPHLSVDFEADQAAIEAHRRSYGVAWPRFDFAQAKLIVSIGADFLDGWGASVPQQLDFADARAKGEEAPRVVYVGARRSLTGLNADQWIPAIPGSELAIVNFLAGKGDVGAAAQQSGVTANVLSALKAELDAARPALVVAGTRGANALDVGLAAAQLNVSLGAVGTTVKTADAVAGFEGISRHTELLEAVTRMASGSVPIAFVRGVNLAYTLPASQKFADAFARVPFKVSFSSYPDETTELCDMVLPDLHSLESWGDAAATPSVMSVQQPTMDPVFAHTRATADVLIALGQKDAANAARYPNAEYRSWLIGRFAGGQSAMSTALAKGISAGSIAARAVAGVGAASASVSQQGDYHFIVYPSPVLGDGRGANKPWLQELPDPVTKIAWSSWVEMHPETAAKLGVDRGDIVEVKTSAGAVRAIAIPYLGIRPDTIAMALGQGHKSAAGMKVFEFKDTEVQWGYGRYARGVGVNPFDAVTTTTDAAGGFVWEGMKASLTKTGDHDIVPSTEGSARQHGRGIAQAIVAGQVEKEEHEEHIPGDASHAFLPGLRSPVAADAQGELGAPTAKDHGKDLGLYDPADIRGMAKRRWAMTIDLARCTGCSACVTACYAENNIPTVGAAWQNATVYAVQKPGFNMSRGREMNWIRLERYYEGANDSEFTPDFEARFVPMLCQHCGNAPCEPVCPVYATYHAPDGLNVQVYNRCVGTRYCSNACPYKVRYFNWFGYGEEDRKQYAFPEPMNWQLNPDVTVRGKGVMEKCTFCVQRIREAENRVALEHREMEPDEFTVACAAACPSRAIVFGDAADPRWTVAQLAADKRAYHVFEELNTYTAVVYLKKVIHPSPAAPAHA